MTRGTVNATSLNMRDDASTGAAVAALLTKGMTVDVITTNEDDTWLLVSALVDGVLRVGWVQSQFVDLPEGAGPVVEKPADIPSNVAALPAGDPAPFAEFASTLTKVFWPIVTTHSQAMVISYKTTEGGVVGRDSRRFFAVRSGGARHHVGIDLFCREGDTVVAAADGVIVNFQFFYNSGGRPTNQLLVRHGDIVVNYGEVTPDSLTFSGVSIGSAVAAGRTIGRVGATGMLHFETYTEGTTVNQRWPVGHQRPAAVLNPTRLLLRLAAQGERATGNIA